MEKNIGPVLKNAKTLLHVKKEMVKLFENTKEKKNISKIGYVAGIIGSDGPKYFEINRKRLANYVEKLRRIHKFPIFSAVDIFSDNIYAQLEEMALPFAEKEEKMRSFWRKILKSGHVTDIFMTPRWDKSKGATDEHKTAVRIGLTVHYIEDEVEKLHISYPLTGKNSYGTIAIRINSRKGRGNRL